MFRPNAEWSEQSGATFPAGMARPMGPYDNTALMGATSPAAVVADAVMVLGPPSKRNRPHRPEARLPVIHSGKQTGARLAYVAFHAFTDWNPSFAF
jgi:hypothetical protein